MRGLLCQLALYFEIAIIGRAILSWFPMSSTGVMYRVNRFLIVLTEPVIGPVRRIMPRTGAFDFSPIIVIVVIEFLIRGLLLGC
jgi:YggT family protein